MNPTISSYRHQVRRAITTNSNVKLPTVTELVSWLTKAIGLSTTRGGRKLVISDARDHVL